MRSTAVLILLLGSLQACKSIDPRQARPTGEAQIVALVVRSEPSDAIVKINKLEKTWRTPCDIADWSLGKGLIDVEVMREGYEPVRTRAQYNGNDPVILEIRLRSAARALPLVLPPPVSDVEARLPVPEAIPAPAKVEATAGGTWIKVSSQGAKLRVEAKSVVTDPTRPGELFLPNVPPEKVRVEFLDPKTDAVLHTVEFTPGPGPAPAARTPEPPPAAEADRVGEVKVVSKTYGVFVKLDPGLALQPGEEILIYRNGKEIARTKILKVTKSDTAYPDGAVQVPKDGSIQKGDEVRRTKP